MKKIRRASLTRLFAGAVQFSLPAPAPAEEDLSDSFRGLIFQEKMLSARIARVSVLVAYNKSLASLSYAMGTNLVWHGIGANLSSKEIRFEEN